MSPKILALAALLALPPGVGLAQYDPAASRAENQVNSLNRSMMQQQQIRGIEQQNRFETNAMRNELSKPAPPPVVPNMGLSPRR
jgi:hypothetical protein